MTHRFIALILILVIHVSPSAAQPLESFPLAAVRLEAGPFLHAQQTDMRYMLQLDPDRLLAPFQIDAGIEPKAARYGNWENTGLDGHIGGHYLSALSMMYASTGNEELVKRLNYMIDKLAECQLKNGNGYVGGIPGGQAMWKEIAEGNIHAASFSLNKKWVPLYNIHKLYAGLRDAYVIAGNKKALDVLIKLSDWFLQVTSTLSNEQVQEMLRSEHGGMNEVFADVAAITGDKKYLVLARKLSHNAILNPLLARKDVLTGLHANTQIPKVIGYKRVAEVSGDTSWSDAASFFWETVVNNRTVSIGGNSVREHFHPAHDFSSMIESNQGPETCNTYNMLRLTRLLFMSNPTVKYIDYYERALYNHILSSQHPGGGFVYFTPMRPRHYRVYSQPQESFWCCVGSGLENHAKYGELIYAHNKEDIYVNLFIASTLEWKARAITLHQQTQFPYEDQTSIKLTLERPQKFTLYIRYPGWVKAGELQLHVNGKLHKVSASPSSFVPVERKWKNGDVVTVTLPMHTRIEYLPDSTAWGSFVHGPIVLAAPVDSSDLAGLKADDSRMGHVAEGKFYPIEEAPMIVKESPDFVSRVELVNKGSLAFSASQIIYPAPYKKIKLIPFFNVHDTRYMLYWRVTTPEDLEAIKQAMHEREKESLAIEARTIDQVAPGEQQPESEHNFKGESTEVGNTNGQAWRTARGWFSYDLKNTNREGKVLRITYSSGGRNRKFDILLNDKLLNTVVLDDSRKKGSFHIDYAIPDDMIKTMSTDRLHVKLVAHEGSVTGRIYSIRLMK